MIVKNSLLPDAAFLFGIVFIRSNDDGELAVQALDDGDGLITQIFRQAHIHDQHIDLFILEGHEQVFDVVHGLEPVSLSGNPKIQVLRQGPATFGDQQCATLFLHHRRPGIPEPSTATVTGWLLVLI
jgi:hypothetical protein